MADPDIESFCAGNLVGTTFTLTANCATTAPLSVPDGHTLDGAGFTISASDPAGGEWNGGIVTNAGSSMNIQNVTISGPVGGFTISHNCNFVVYGILFEDAGGSVNNVTVQHIWQQPNASGAASCQTGTGIRAQNPTAPRTVTITGSTVVDTQKNGIDGRGAGMTMNVSGSTIGPPNNQEGLIAANGLVYVSGATGTATGNTINGSGDEQLPGPPGGGTDATAVLLWGSTNVTIDHNTITGTKTDLGVAVAAGATGSVISFNQIGRTAPDNPDPTGHGINVEDPLVRIGPDAPTAQASESGAATLICNTFSNWNHNVVGALQIACTGIPDGCVDKPYSAHTPAVEGVTTALTPPALTWSVTAGTLPPGLTLAPDGAITGTPTEEGTFHFTVQVNDPSSSNLIATQDESIAVPSDCAPATTTTTVPVSVVGSTVPVTTAAPATTAAPVSATSTGTLPRTGGSASLPLLGLALVATGTLVAGIARRTHNQQHKTR